MKHSLTVGFSFGLTSGIITTLGLVVGLYSSTNSRLVVIGGILTIALADALSDAFGIHVSEESENRHSKKQVWEATLSTFFSKLVFALTFVIPVLIFSLSLAVFISVLWGLALLSVFSYHLAKKQSIKPWKVIGEHLLLAIAVVILTHYLGKLIAIIFA